MHLSSRLLAGGGIDRQSNRNWFGKVENISPLKISLSTGQAFVLSGHALDKMTQYSRMTIAIPNSAGPLSDWLPVVSHLCDSLIGQWTRRHAEIVRAAIDPTEPEQEKVAQALKPAVSRQAVTKGLSGANWYVIREALRLFEETSWETVL